MWKETWLQRPKSPSSIEHSNVAPASAENAKIGFGSVVNAPSARPESVVVSGGMQSAGAAAAGGLVGADVAARRCSRRCDDCGPRCDAVAPNATMQPKH